MKILSIIIIIIFSALKVYGHGTIIIQDVEHEKGEIDVKIYMDKKSFLNEGFAVESIRKKPTKGETIISLAKVHEGRIAIAVYHDEDGNGELKTGLFWAPKEGFAFSNNYTPKGPPSFKKASIELIHGEPVIIELNY